MEMFLLVGGFNPSEQYGSIGMIITNIWKNKKRSKPPTTLSLDSSFFVGQTTMNQHEPDHWKRMILGPLS